MRVVIVGCNVVGQLLGKLLCQIKDVEIQYIDNKEQPKPKLKIGSEWCKYSQGELYLFCDQTLIRVYKPLLDEDVVKLVIAEI